MKKIVPFKKEIIFKTSVSEITSISLEHSLQIKDNNLISGNFIISGEYRIADTSINTDVFNFELPCDINVDEKYDLSNVNVDIDDFYYEIVNNKSLEVNIEVLIDKLVEKPLIEKDVNDINYDLDDEELKQTEIDSSEDREMELGNNEEQVTEGEDEIMERCIEKEDILSEFNSIDDMFDKVDNTDRPATVVEIKEQKSIEKINSLFDNLDASTETYKTYKVCIIRTGDTLESVMQKYSISKEELEKYNNLSEIKIGDKLIIPSISNEKI